MDGKVKWFFVEILRRVRAILFHGSGVRSWYVSHDADLGKGVRVQRGSVIDGATKIGKYTYIGERSYVTKACIGNYCAIANNVSIGQGEHLLTKVSVSSVFYDNAYSVLTSEEVVIGNDVWIGTGVVILRGVKVGDGAVVGANSTVTRDVPDYAVVVGSPARVVKYRFDSEHAAKLKKSKWWELDLTDARSFVEKYEKDNL
ncbi:CatB-related O-acetyltransferase [Salinibius halmophilus]|uniref:CatB-related O-acetyltransferase n=1 Tax=Salinibius halmophilus TaxID=1853216 RepID=UPI002D77D2EE|nr:CatB-related O-acetyltransferase [Salinibius halmophilus]